MVESNCLMKSPHLLKVNFIFINGDARCTYLKNRDVIWNSQSNLFWQSHTFADLNPKVPGLILYFLCFCHSKSFFGLLISSIPCQPGACWLSTCVSRPLTFLHFPWCPFLSLFFTDGKKKTTCRTDLSNIMPQSKEPYRHPMEVMLSHCIFQSSTCCSFTISVSITDFSIQTQMKRIRDMRAW